MSTEKMIQSLFEQFNGHRIVLRNLVLERIMNRALLIRKTVFEEHEPYVKERDCLLEIQAMAQNLLLGDAELNFAELEKKIDELKDGSEKRVFKTLFAFIAEV